MTSGRSFLPLLLLLAACAGPPHHMDHPKGNPPPPPLPGTYQIDPVHSGVIFAIDHLGVSRFTGGRFNEISGTLTISSADPTDCVVAVEVAAKSIDTNNEKRDTHLRSADFFDVEKYPAISFKSRSCRALHPGHFLLSGDLTLLGVSHPIEAEVRYSGYAETEKLGKRVGYQATFRILRGSFGMHFMPDMIGDEVTIVVNLEAMLPQAKS